MTTQSIVCGSCSADVPYGRLSCPSCGELLASVARARRGRATAARPAVPARAPDVLYEVGSAPSAEIDSGGLAHDGGRDLDSELPWAASAGGAVVELDGQDDGLEDAHADLGGLLDADGDEDLVADGSTTAGHAWAVAGAHLTSPATPKYMPRPNPARAPTAPAAEAPAAASPLASELPGAYVPPQPAASMPAGPPLQARAWAGYTGSADDGQPVASEGKPPRTVGVDASRLDEFVGSVSVAGGALAAVGFLLPWASTMIGSSGSAYIDRWGFAGPAHIVVVLGILAILALGIVKNPVPTWIRTGIGGLGMGALLLGLTWPYLLGPLDAAPGVLIDAIGAIALIGSGILAIVIERHAEVDQPV